MELTKYSEKRIKESFNYWNVEREFSDSIYNYLVYGYNPGSCFTAVLANDFLGAMVHSHPANTVEAFKSLAKWIHCCMPPSAFGGYDRVQAWSTMETAERRAALEKWELIYTEEQEVWMALQDTAVEA
jgi:hypothetical protein